VHYVPKALRPRSFLIDPQMPNIPQYAAFISYARADQDIAARLHKRLEAYRVPSHLRLNGAKRIAPVFRDQAELAAHKSLSATIELALERSEALIVLCSPDAKASHWVSEEIKKFRALYPDRPILCALVNGTPQTAFPEALLEDGAEPLAASMDGDRPQERFGTQQLIASLLGVGLDTILQRDAERRRKRLSLMGAGAAAFSAIMAAMTVFAVSAQHAAERNRAEAEGLVEFMLTDLKAQLEPAGRLELLNGVGDKVIEYYADQPIETMENDRLARRARAQHLLGQVSLSTRQLDKAAEDIRAASAMTARLLERGPNDAALIYNHAQSLYWQGELARRNGDYEAARAPWDGYINLATQLYQINHSNFDWIMERAWAEQNLGALDALERNYESAIVRYDAALKYFSEAAQIDPENPVVAREIASVSGWQADATLITGIAEDVIHFRQRQVDLLREELARSPQNITLAMRLVVPERELLILQYLQEGSDAMREAWRIHHARVERLHQNDPSNARMFRELCLGEAFQLGAGLYPDIQSNYKRHCGQYLETFEAVAEGDIFIATFLGGKPPQDWNSWLDNATPQQKLFTGYFHMQQLIASNDMQAVQQIAEAITKHDYSEQKDQSPQHLLNLIEAYRILGNCGAHLKMLNAYTAKGYIYPLNVGQKNTC
jgi:tetratricopeptide (TPR) repeat protein